MIENGLRGTEISYSIIGIGLNINQEGFENSNAISLKKLAGINYDLQNCLDTLCSCIEVRYFQFLNKNRNTLKSEYVQRLFRLNKNLNYEIIGKSVEGKIVGVSKDGKLLLELNNDQTILELGLKEVKFV